MRLGSRRNAAGLRMVYAGEDPFHLQAMLIFASEDVGLADPNALQFIADAASAFDRVGLPEGRFALSHAALYLATAPEQFDHGFFRRLSAVEKEHEEEYPITSRMPTEITRDLVMGQTTCIPMHFAITGCQQYLPSSLQGRVFYQPSIAAAKKRWKRGPAQTRAQTGCYDGASNDSRSFSFSPPDKTRARGYSVQQGNRATN